MIAVSRNPGGLQCNAHAYSHKLRTHLSTRLAKPRRGCQARKIWSPRRIWMLLENGNLPSRDRRNKQALRMLRFDNCAQRPFFHRLRRLKPNERVGIEQQTRHRALFSASSSRRRPTDARLRANLGGHDLRIDRLRKVHVAVLEEQTLLEGSVPLQRQSLSRLSVLEDKLPGTRVLSHRETRR